MSGKDRAKRKSFHNLPKFRRFLNDTDKRIFSQRSKIIEWFKVNSSLTTEEARHELGIMHPAGRIEELRKRGYYILTYWDNYPTRDGQLHRMAKYVLMSRKGGEDE